MRHVKIDFMAVTSVAYESARTVPEKILYELSIGEKKLPLFSCDSFCHHDVELIKSGTNITEINCKN